MKPYPSVAALAEGVIRAEAPAVARAISLVEDGRASSEPSIIELLERVGKSDKRAACHRVGITGPPGVGKSSLVGVLSRELRARGRSVGVLAVDPSSPRSGGALLGDRARIEVDPDDAGLFVRSMASGGHLGGLARAAGAALDVLAAAYDVVVVETTGVGQSETDVEHVADSVVMVIQPASGDMLQFLKAGILEIPDVFVINKADLGTVAERAGNELSAALEAVLVGEAELWRPPLVFTSATTARGVGDLVDAIDRHREALLKGQVLEARRIAAQARWAVRLFTYRHGELGVERTGGARALEKRFGEWIASGITAVEAVIRANRELPS